MPDRHTARILRDAGTSSSVTPLMAKQNMKSSPTKDGNTSLNALKQHEASTNDKVVPSVVAKGAPSDQKPQEACSSSAALSVPSLPNVQKSETTDKVVEKHTKAHKQTIPPSTPYQENPNIPEAQDTKASEVGLLAQKASNPGPESGRISETEHGTVTKTAPESSASQKPMSNAKEADTVPISLQVSAAQGTPPKQARQQRKKSKSSNKGGKDQPGTEASSGPTLTENEKPGLVDKSRTENQGAVRSTSQSTKKVPAAPTNNSDSLPKPSSEQRIPPPNINSNEFPPLIDRKSVPVSSEPKQHEINENSQGRDSEAKIDTCAGAASAGKKDSRNKDVKGVLVATPLIQPFQQTKAAARKVSTANDIKSEIPNKSPEIIQSVQRGFVDRPQDLIPDPRPAKADKSILPKAAISDSNPSNIGHKTEDSQKSTSAALVAKDVVHAAPPAHKQAMDKLWVPTATSKPGKEDSNSLAKESERKEGTAAPEEATTNKAGIDAQQLSEKLGAISSQENTGSPSVEQGLILEKDNHPTVKAALHSPTKSAKPRDLNDHIPYNVEQTSLAISKSQQAEIKNLPSDKANGNTDQQSPKETRPAAPKQDATWSSTSSLAQPPLQSSTHKDARSPERTQHPLIPDRSSSLPRAPVPEPIHTRHKKKKKSKGAKSVTQSTTSQKEASTASAPSKDHLQVSPNQNISHFKSWTFRPAHLLFSSIH